ncbi:MAG: hypothetical protein IJX90_09360 [Blautia sp.]|nr:hypothetical protein [Blautia sp.]
MAVTEIKNPTPIESDLEKAIKDRLFNGFNNWNGGYDGWLEWCKPFMSQTLTTTSTANA